MAVGICHLCGQHAELVDSHVWPSFAYKRYVSDLVKGGQFFDLQKKNAKASRHYTEPWFCERCDRDVLGPNEKYTAEFCQRLDKAQTDAHAYDVCLLRFAVSISWRSVKAHRGPRHYDDDIAAKACKRWKAYLRGKETSLGPYTQHLFIVFDQEVPLHKGLGGQVFPEERLVLSQIGPLFIIGLLDRRHLSVHDLEVWSHSTLSEEGGAIKPISEWRVGSEITKDCARLLCGHEARVKRTILETASRNRRQT